MYNETQKARIIMRPTQKAELIERAEQLARRCQEITKANDELVLEASISREDSKKIEAFIAYARAVGEFFGFCKAMYRAHIFSAGDLLNLKKLAFDEIRDEGGVVPPSIASFINSLETIDALDVSNRGDS